MAVDAEHPVVKLCIEGVNEEMAGNTIAAESLYARAWAICDDDFGRCIVAHYMARVQPTHRDRLEWNLRSLDFASNADPLSVAAFYPSLYLNIGKSYEDIGNETEALKYYHLGENACGALANDRLGNITKEGLRNGIARMTAK